MILHNRYKYDTISDTIGSGSYGACYKALDLRTTKQVCIKIMTIKPAMPLEQLEQEAQLLEQLKHESVAHGIEHFCEKIGGLNSLVIVMSFYVNADARGYINDKYNAVTEVPEGTRVRWMLQLLSAVTFIHQNNIVHRDLKLENGFLDEQLNFYLGDFGIAKQVKQDRATTFIGTCETMAPEVINGNPYNTKADIWSLGCVWYELISGKKPFAGEKQFLTCQNIVAGKYDKLNVPQLQKFQKGVEKMLVGDQYQRATGLELMQFFKEEYQQYFGNNESQLEQTLAKSRVFDKQYQNTLQVFQKTTDENLLEAIHLIKRILNGEQINQVLDCSKLGIVENIDYSQNSIQQLLKEDQIMTKYFRDIRNFDVPYEELKRLCLLDMYKLG